MCDFPVSDSVGVYWNLNGTQLMWHCCCVCWEWDVWASTTSSYKATMQRQNSISILGWCKLSHCQVTVKISIFIKHDMQTYLFLGGNVFSLLVTLVLYFQVFKFISCVSENKADFVPLYPSGAIVPEQTIIKVSISVLAESALCSRHTN